MRICAVVNLVLTLLLAAVGCDSRRVIVNNGMTVHENYWREAVQSLSGRAQIALGCSQERIAYKLISRQGKVPTQIMAEGCGSRGLWARPARHRDGWERIDAPAIAGGPAIQVNTTVQLR